MSNSSKSKVVLRSARGRTNVDALEDVVRDVMETLRWREIVKPGASVAVKLNLNTADPDKIEMANTSPVLAEALCRVLKEQTDDVSLVEAHAYRNSAEEAFEASGIYGVAERAGVKVVSLSKVPGRAVDTPLISPLPAMLLDVDVFITMPVIKTHALTYFTGSLKNQWGCVPRFDRIALHYGLDELLLDLHRLLKPQLCIMDGLVGVEGRGPTNGKPRRLNVVLGSRDGVALDASAARLVGLDPTKCRHLVMAHEAGMGKFNESEIELDADMKPDWEPFEPAKLDWAVAGMNHMTKYTFFRRHFLENDLVFNSGKKAVNALRNVGIVR